MPHIDTLGGIPPELLLKTVPPRPPYRALTRWHLGLDAAPFAGVQIVLLEAATGWGKSALLAQWRRSAIDAGNLAAWLSVGPADDASRLMQGLTLALDRACGAPHRQAAAIADPVEAATGWLAFAAAQSGEVLLLVDDIEQLPAGSGGLLRYLLHNLPSNVRVALAGRSGLRSMAAHLEPADWLLAGPAQLRLTVEEACALATASGAGADEGARLHEDTEGWPLGVQLALRARSRTQAQPDHRRMVAGMLDALAPADRGFLLDLAICDFLHPALCTAVTGDPGSAARLARLAADTPLFTEAEDGGWMRLHTLARDALRRQLAGMPASRLAPLHLHASAWFEAQGMLHDAARHAHAAGADQRAFGLAERGLLELVRGGQLDALAVWRDLLPDGALRGRPRLRLAVAWSLALSERPERAAAHIDALLADAGDDPLLCYESALVGCAAHVYADTPDRFAALFSPWAEQPPAGADPWLRQAHVNRSAALALLHGRPAQASWHLGTAGARVDGSYGARWAELLAGYSYLWQGQARLAADVLQAPVASADAALGRRHPLSTMLAAVLAAASFECGRIEAAQLLLANRLDVLERSATPDVLMLGHLAAARIAAVLGMEHRALDLCEALLAAGERRGLPRVCMAALGEQIRLHAAHERPESCSRLYARLLDWFEGARTQGPLWERQALFLRDMACAHVALSRGDWRGTLAALEQAADCADALQLGRAALDIMGLRARALDRIDGSGAALAREAAGLARTYGHAGPSGPPAGAPALAPAPAVRQPPTATAAGAAVLTPKEREVLELLARKLSNKEIAHILAVTDETVKWHLKNLFAKVEAGSRRHAISRAMTLGLLE
jgi:LuxR family maltose regulon positive regulatory protein